MGYKVVGVRYGKGKDIAIFNDRHDAETYCEDVWMNSTYYEDIYVIDQETGEIIAQFES